MSFGSSSSGLGLLRKLQAPAASQHVSGKRAAPRTPALDLPALQGVSRLVQDHLIKDAQVIPDLGDMLNARKSI